MSVTAVHRKADRSLNSLGYPLRPDGQAEICRYFAETGYCKYSTSCKHHHPEEYCTKRIERQQARQEREKNAEIAAKRNTTTEEVTPAGSGPKQQQKTPSPDQASKPTAVKETSTTTKTAAPENEDEDWTPVKRGKAPKKTSGDAGAANSTTTTLPQTTAPSKLIGFNSRGFPLREGADECQYYVNTLGLCRHGQYCKHTHPEWICEFAQDKPRAIIAPQYQGKTGLAGKHSEKPQPEIPKDPAAMRAEIQRQLKALGLPSNACYYHFVLDNCRNQNCVWKHEVTEEDLLSVSDAENEEAREEEPDIVEKIAAVEKEIPRNNKPATKQTAAEVVKKSLIEQQADTIVSKLKLSPELGPSIVDAAKGCGAKESLAEIATSILSQALLLKKMSGEEMRTICKEVALLRASKTT